MGLSFAVAEELTKLMFQVELVRGSAVGKTTWPLDVYLDVQDVVLSVHSLIDEV